METKEHWQRREIARKGRGGGGMGMGMGGMEESEGVGGWWGLGRRVSWSHLGCNVSGGKVSLCEWQESLNLLQSSACQRTRQPDGTLLTQSPTATDLHFNDNWLLSKKKKALNPWFTFFDLTFTYLNNSVTAPTFKDVLNVLLTVITIEKNHWIFVQIAVYI